VTASEEKRPDRIIERLDALRDVAQRIANIEPA
jgi:hypothetical protein